MIKIRNRLLNAHGRDNFIKLYNEINEFSLKKPNNITINKLISISQFSKEKRLLLSSNYLYNQMPIRLAKRIKDLELFPFETNNTINNVRKWYINSFIDFRSYDKTNFSNESFLKLVETIYNRHNLTFIYMAKGISDLRKVNKLNNIDVNEVLNRFYLSRIGIRLLLNHYIYLNHEHRDDYCGVICLQTNPKKILEDAFDEAIRVASFSNKLIPKYEIRGHDLYFPYIPEHLYYIFVEIIKNSIVAINKTHYKGIIKCDIYHDNNLIIIKIHDNGIGIKKDDLSKLYNYGYTTSPINFDDKFEQDFTKEAILTGLGYGLPISKLFIEYFGGWIEIFSEYNKGTDIYLYIKKNVNLDDQII